MQPNNYEKGSPRKIHKGSNYDKIIPKNITRVAGSVFMIKEAPRRSKGL
jgi:hypothetical protein